MRFRFLMLVCMLLAMVAPSQAATYYVRTTGADGAGHTGLTGDPWLTITYAETRIASGDTVNIGAGTYTENAGSGYLLFNGSQAYAAETTLQSESGLLDVVVTGTSGAYNVLISSNASHLTFKNLWFQSHTSTVDTVRSSRSNYILFDGCRFDANGAAAAGLHLEATSTNSVANTTAQNCLFSTGSASSIGIYAYRSGTSALDVVTLSGNVYSGSGCGLYVRGNVTNGASTNDECTTSSTTYPAIQVLNCTTFNITGANITDTSATLYGIKYTGAGGAACGGTLTNCTVHAVVTALELLTNVDALAVSGGSYYSSAAATSAIVANGDAGACGAITLTGVTAQSATLPPVHSSVTTWSDTGGSYTQVIPPPHHYYVATTGSDAADGSAGAPWLTIAHALAVASASDTVDVAAGTYVEAGGLICSTGQAYTAETVIRAQSGLNDVTIKGSASLYSLYLHNGCSYLTFRNVTLEAWDDGTVCQCAARIATANHITFDACVFTGKGAGRYGCYALGYNGGSIASLTFTGCSFTADNATGTALYVGGTANEPASNVTLSGNTVTSQGTGEYFYGKITTLSLSGETITANGAAAVGLQVQGPSSAQAASGVTVSNVVVHAAYSGAAFAGVTGLAVNGLKCYSTSSKALSVGTDSQTSVTTSGTLRNVQAISTNSHGLLVGWSTSGVTVTGGGAKGGDYTLVMKEGASNIVQGMTLQGGSAATAYFKAGNTNTVRNCRIECNAGGAAFQMDQNNVGNNKVVSCQATGNRVRVSAAGRYYNLVAAGDGGGNVFDRNQWRIGTSNTHPWGAIWGTNCDTYAAARAAWAGYGDGTNDAHTRRW